MKKSTVKFFLIFMIFFIGSCSIITVDNICRETTGQGGKLVFDVEMTSLFN